MQSMAFAFPVKPGKAQEWREWGRELRGARRNEFLAFRHQMGLTTNRLYFQQRPQRDLVIFYFEGRDLGRTFQHLRTAQDSFAVRMRQRTLELFEGFDLTETSPETLSVLAFDEQGLEDNEARDHTQGTTGHEVHSIA